MISGTIVKNRLRELSTLRKSMDRVDRKRKMRLRTARDNRDFRSMILRWSKEKDEPKLITSAQREAILYLSDFSRNFTREFIAEKLRISVSTINKWMNTPLFIRQLDLEITRRRTFCHLYAMRNVNRAIMRGSMKDTWNYLKMIGVYKENVEIVDKTGEPSELTDEQLDTEIHSLNSKLTVARKTNSKLRKQLKVSNVPSDN